MFGVLRSQRFARVVKLFFNTCKQTNGHKWLSNSRHTDDYIRQFISENTEVAEGQSLTPEIKLRLLTPSCKFWRERPQLWPFEDPYWAIYWPGGQAISR